MPGPDSARASLVFGHHQEVTANEEARAIRVADRWRYVWGASRRPFLHPVRTPAGDVLTRDAPDDHPWHHGLWFTIKFVNGENFWEEYGDYGVLRHDEAPRVVEHANGVTEVSGAVRWIRPDRLSVAVQEHRRLTHVPLGADAYAIDLHAELSPTVDTVFDRTPFTTWGGYGGLTLRGRGDWHDTRLLLADGSVNDRVIGQPAAWCDLSGETAGGGGGGMAMFDAPSNPRFPTAWYGSTRADTYGDDGWSNFLNAAFLFHEPLAVPAGDTLVLDHRVVVHDGTWEAGRISQAYEAWLAESRRR
jgi:hypothetical protein